MGSNNGALLALLPSMFRWPVGWLQSSPSVPPANDSRTSLLPWLPLWASEWIAKGLAMLGDPDVKDVLLEALGAILAAFVIWAFIKFLRFPSMVFAVLSLRRRWQPRLSEQLEHYRQRLNTETFSIRHSWLKEGQTLNDILIPVVVTTDGQQTSVESWLTVLSQSLLGPEGLEAPRLVIIGGPGTGKSVSLRVAARHAWTLSSADRDTSYIPVLITFSEYRNAGFNLYDVLTDSLQKRGFSESADGDDTLQVQEFVRESLAQGRLLILIDALDELEIEDRKRAARELESALKSHPYTPVILSCRVAAWHGQIHSPALKVIEMADFTPAAIRQFVQKWQFQSPKSAYELLEVINTQIHVGELAKNPLLLTIVCFLYSQPKYRLPDNRAQFYEVCARALLEEWDQAENPSRANYFDRPHKESLLSQLAYDHIKSVNPDRDIDEHTALDTFAASMQASLGLKRADNHHMLDEIVVNSGLVFRLPPSGLRFPHQTFLEYFAAQHILRTYSPDQLLNHYHSDPDRWRDVLLLYCGLNTKQDEVSHVLADLLQRGEVARALAALTDVRIVEQGLASRILDAVEELITSNPTSGLLASLGYLAANTKSAHATRAHAMLQILLTRDAAHLSPEIFQALLLAVLRQPTEETIRYVIDNLDRLHLDRLLPTMGEKALLISTAILRHANLTTAKKLEWIDGLRRAQMISILGDLAITDNEGNEIQRAATVALARNSKSPEFWSYLEQFASRWQLTAEDDHWWRRWGWPFDLPSSTQSKRVAFHLASCLAQEIINGRYSPQEIAADNMHPRLLYLACSLYRARGYRWDNPLNFYGPQILRSTWVHILRGIWRKMNREGWRAWMSKPREPVFMTAFIASCLIQLLIVGYSLFHSITQWFGWNIYAISIPYTYTLAILVFQFILCSTFAICNASFDKREIDYEDIYTPMVLFFPLFIYIMIATINREKATITTINREKAAIVVSIACLLTLALYISITPINIGVKVALLVLSTISFFPMVYIFEATSRGATPSWEPDRDTVELVAMLNDNSPRATTDEAP